MIQFEIASIFFFASVLIIIALGSGSIFVMTQGALHGRGARLLATTGACTGLLVHTAAEPSGVAANFQTSALAFIALGLIRYWLTIDGLRLDVDACVSGFECASGTRAAVPGKPAR